MLTDEERKAKFREDVLNSFRSLCKDFFEEHNGRVRHGRWWGFIALWKKEYAVLITKEMLRKTSRYYVLKKEK